MKSGSKGYASFDYTFKEYQTSKLDKLDILINKEPVDALSMICAKKDSYHRGLALCQKLKELIPRHQIQILFKLQLDQGLLQELILLI